MTNDTQISSESTEHKRIPFGKRLKTAREAMSLDRKDVAAQLHLNEKVILMMESDRYPSDLPVTFIRGYLRSYAKLLQIPDYETRQAVEPIKPKSPFTIPTQKTSEPMNSGSYFFQFFTYLIGMTVIGLVGVWWYTHYMPNFNLLTKSTFINQIQNQVSPDPPTNTVDANPSPTNTAESQTLSVNATNSSEQTASNVVSEPPEESNPMSLLNNKAAEKKEEVSPPFPYTAANQTSTTKTDPTKIEQPKNTKEVSATNQTSQEENEEDGPDEIDED